MKNELKIALAVMCPVCNAAAGQKCFVMENMSTISRRRPASHPHKERVELGAQRLLNTTFVGQNVKPITVIPQDRPCPPVPPPAPTVDPSKFVTHIALLVDSSRSMQHLASKTVQVFNDQLDNIQKNAKDTQQKTFISVYSFDTHTKAISQHGDPAYAIRLSNGNNYKASGNSTALLDAVYTAIQDFNALRAENDINHSFLLLTITDGLENDSHQIGRADLTDIITKKQNSDRWSFAFLVPPGGRQAVKYLGIPDGNIQEWELSSRGLDTASANISTGMSDYMLRRSKGQKSTQTFFASAANITQTDLNKLANLSRNFHRWEVNRDGIQIRDFVVNQNGFFMAGRSYYQLMKSEKVQPTKDFLIMHKRTGAIYGGDDARRMLGVAKNQYVHVRPGQTSDYEIFVRSDSHSRKLPKGSILLYKI